MEILPASLLDLNALHKLEHACFDKDAWSFLDLLAVLSFPDVIRLKAAEDDQMVGFVAGEQRSSEGHAWIATIAIHPRYRRRGFGRALLRACENQLNAPCIKLTVRMSNYGAIALYEREGYQTSDVWKTYYSDGEDGVVMEKVR